MSEYMTDKMDDFYMQGNAMKEEIDRLTAENAELKTRLSGRTYYHDNEAVEAKCKELEADCRTMAEECVKYFNENSDAHKVARKYTGKESSLERMKGE